MPGSPQQAKAVRFGPFELDLRTCCLTRRGRQERLALQPGRLLVLLVQRRGTLVTREELHSQLWPDDTFGDFDHGLNNAVNRLREALGDSAVSPRYIQTSPRRGYRFIADVALVAPLLADEAKASLPEPGDWSGTPTDFGPDVRSPGAREGDYAFSRSTPEGIGSVSDRTVVCIRQSIDTGSEHREAEPHLPIVSIAVSPLRNSSGDASQNYLTEILTETFLSELAQIRRLKVYSSSALPKLGTVGELRVNLLIEGSVVQLADQMRIAVHVLQRSPRLQIWSQTYDRGLGEVLAVLKEMAAAIATQVLADVSPHGPTDSNPARTVEPEAYDCYLRGRFYAQHQNKVDNEIAMSAFERATAIDPHFAPAYAELAQTYVWKLFLFAPHERQWQEKAFMSVEKALSLDPHLAVAYLARGRLLWTPANRFPHIRAIRDYRRAVALNPHLDEARNQLALIYCHIGYFQDALRESQEASLANPNNHLAIYRTAQTLAFQGEHEQALVILRGIPKTVNPSLIGYQTAWVLFNLGKGDEAPALIDQLLEDYPEDDGALYLSMQALFAASRGEHTVAGEKIEVAIKTGSGFGHFHHSAYHIAVAFALMNKTEQAVRWLEFAAVDGFPCYPLFESDVNLAKIRRDIRFVEFMAKLKHRWARYSAMF